MCMVLYDTVGSRYDNEINDFGTCFFLPGIVYNRLVIIK